MKPNTLFVCTVLLIAICVVEAQLQPQKVATTKKDESKTSYHVAAFIIIGMISRFDSRLYRNDSILTI